MVRELSALFELLHRKEDQSMNPSNNKQPKDFIVDFYDAFSNIDEGGVGLMIEYMDGGSLQDIVEDGGCDNESTLATIAYQALQGLSFLHSSSQLHRDLKPSNFLISHTGDVKIADLGIMKQLEAAPYVPSKQGALMVDTSKASKSNNGSNNNVLDSGEIQHSRLDECNDLKSTPIPNALENDDSETTQKNTLLKEANEGMLNSNDLIPYMSYSMNPSLPRTHTFVGTATYMSPERIDGKDYSFPADIWAFGLSLMAIAMGKLPFDTSGGYWMLVEHIRDESLIPYLPNKFSSRFREFLECCLDRKPSKRWTCLELLEHPFIVSQLKRGIEEIDLEYGKDDQRGLFELRSILDAIGLHVQKLLEERKKMHANVPRNSSQDTSSPIFGDIDMNTSTVQLLYRIFFGVNCVSNVSKHDEEVVNVNTDMHRVSILAKQLYLTEKVVVDEVLTFIRGYKL